MYECDFAPTKTIIKIMEYSKPLLAFRNVLHTTPPYFFAIQPIFRIFYVALKKNSFYMINDAVTKELGYVRDRNKASNLGLDGCKKGRYCKWRVQTKYHLRETGQAMMQERVFF